MKIDKRLDFIDNLKMANIHLTILTDDIKYPLAEDRLKMLELSQRAISTLMSLELQDDLEKYKKEVQ